MTPLLVGGAHSSLGLAGGGSGLMVEAIAQFLAAVSAYWMAAALALLMFALKRRPGILNTLISVAIAWLLLRGLGALLRLLVPCFAPDSEAAFGFVAAIALIYLLPLRLWQRGLCLGLVVLTAATRSFALGCRVPGELGLAASAALAAGTLLWLLSRWPAARQLWQRASLALDNWGALQSRIALTPPLQAVLAARLCRHLGVTVERLEPVGGPGVHASTPVVLAGRDREGRPCRYFVKIVSRQNWQSSVVYEGMRWLQHRGRFRSGPMWPSLKALVEYEHYMLLLFSASGVPVPRPQGVYRLERHVYALVTDYLEGAQSPREVGQVSAACVRQALEALRRMRAADLAHLDLKASNLLVLPGQRVALVDLALAEYAAGPRRLARDLADMLAALAMHHGPQGVVASAREIIGLEGLRQASTYLHRGLINEEMGKMLPPDLLSELRRLIAREARRARGAG
jgi:hypothetical protein